MLSRPDSNPTPPPFKKKNGGPRPSLQRIAATLQLGGWIGFWVQLALGLAAILLLLIAVPGLAGQGAAQGVSIGIFWATCGVIVAAFNTVLSFRYTRIAKGLIHKTNEPQPRKTETVQLLRMGIYAGMIGVVLTLIGSGVAVYVLVSKAVSQPAGVAITDPTKIVRPLDVFVVVANLAGISANFMGMVISLWLYDRIDRPSS